MIITRPVTGRNQAQTRVCVCVCVWVCISLAWLTDVRVFAVIINQTRRELGKDPAPCGRYSHMSIHQSPRYFAPCTPSTRRPASHVFRRLERLSCICRILIADQKPKYWPQLSFFFSLLFFGGGGTNRCDSVFVSVSASDLSPSPFSSAGVTIRYVLPVLWTTSFLPQNGPYGAPCESLYKQWYDSVDSSQGFHSNTVVVVCCILGAKFAMYNCLVSVCRYVWMCRLRWLSVIDFHRTN